MCLTTISMKTPSMSDRKAKEPSRLDLIVSMFHRLNQDYFHSSIPLPKFRLSRRMTTSAGSVLYGTNRHTMTISIPYHDHFGWGEELVSTLKHEMIHLYLERHHGIRGHGSLFSKYCKMLGTERFCRTRPERGPVYIYICPNCDAEYTYRRKVRLYCGHCHREGGFSDRRLRLTSTVHPSMEAAKASQPAPSLTNSAPRRGKQMFLPGLEVYLPI